MKSIASTGVEMMESLQHAIPMISQAIESTLQGIVIHLSEMPTTAIQYGRTKLFMHGVTITGSDHFRYVSLSLLQKGKHLDA